MRSNGAIWTPTRRSTSSGRGSRSRRCKSSLHPRSAACSTRRRSPCARCSCARCSRGCAGGSSWGSSGRTSTRREPHSGPARALAGKFDDPEVAPVAASDRPGPTLKAALARLPSRFKGRAGLHLADGRQSDRSGQLLASRLGAGVRRSKLRRIRFHDLRHTYASLLIAQGAHPKYIQAQLGHASIQTTLDRYGHLMPEMHDGGSAETRPAGVRPRDRGGRGE